MTSTVLPILLVVVLPDRQELLALLVVPSAWAAAAAAVLLGEKKRITEELVVQVELEGEERQEAPPGQEAITEIQGSMVEMALMGPMGLMVQMEQQELLEVMSRAILWLDQKVGMVRMVVAAAVAAAQVAVADKAEVCW